MTTKEFKVEVLKELQAHRDLLTEWKTDAAVVATSSDATAKSSALSREAMLGQVLEALAETVEDVEALDDGPPLQDESELAHNELDLHDVPRLSDGADGQGNALPLWFRIKKLVERDDPPSLQATLEESEPPNIHIPAGERFPTQLVAGILDSVFNNDQKPLAHFAAKLMANSSACQTCHHFYDASLTECPNPKCPAEYITDELEPLADADADTLLAAADAALYCQVCRQRGRLSSLEETDDGSQVCLRCDWRSGEPNE